MTQVLLPVTVLLRRAYAAAVVWAGVVARAGGLGYRRVASLVGVGEATVRGWLRRMAGRLEPVRVWFTRAAVAVGVDMAVPGGLGCAWRDVLAAVGAAVVEVRGRFGEVGLLGAVTAGQVAVALSGGRLLSPGWPGAAVQHELPLTPGGGRG